MKHLFLILLGLVALAHILLFTGCANIIPPTGGPRDTLAPLLLKSDPPNYSVHFKGNIIQLSFDEYLELKDPRKNIIESPVAKHDPVIEGKLKTITIKIKDTLKENTTYSIEFGNSIRDINEGNILKHFSYVFSTGSYLDSMTYSGKVVLAESGKKDSSLIAMLYENLDDSAVIKEKPTYITTTDTGGNFKFSHLKPGTYALYALKDDGGQRKYMSKSMLFAFADSTVTVGETSKPLTLYAYADTTGGKSFKKAAAKPTAKKPKKEEDKDKRLILSYNAGTGLDLKDSLKLTSLRPLKFFDSGLVKVTDEKFNELKGYHWILDSTRTKFTLAYHYTIGTKYNLILDKQFAEDSSGYKLLKIDTIPFQTKKESEYGSIKFHFRNLNLAKNPVLLFVVGDAIKYSIPITKPIYTDKLFEPGEYELRILYDDNKNGVWDPGVFIGKHKQPEIVRQLKSKENIKANWDTEEDFYF